MCEFINDIYFSFTVYILLIMKDYDSAIIILAILFERQFQEMILVAWYGYEITFNGVCLLAIVNFDSWLKTD